MFQCFGRKQEPKACNLKDVWKADRDHSIYMEAASEDNAFRREVARHQLQEKVHTGGNENYEDGSDVR